MKRRRVMQGICAAAAWLALCVGMAVAQEADDEDDYRDGVEVAADDDEDDYEEDGVFSGIVDEYTGWEYEPAKKVEVTRGQLRIVLQGDKGSFGLYAINKKGKKIPLLSSYDNFASSYFSLRVGRKEYRLNYTGGVQSEARVTPYGAQMVYTIPHKAYFVLDFSFPDETASSTLVEDVVRVSLYTVNLGQTPQSFTVKGVFDTVLGENGGEHFSTRAIPSVKTQKQFYNMDEDLWIRSSSGKAAVQFMLNGGNITKPESVSLTTVDALSKYWVPEVYESKGFNSVLAYNNSGIAVNWKTSYLMPMQTSVITFYISAAEGVAPVYAGKAPAGKELISALEAGNIMFPEFPDKRAVAAAIRGTPETHAPQELSPAARAVTAEQLDYEYIQNLIDYIESLERAEDIDEDELRSLNEELDAIFEKLRSLE